MPIKITGLADDIRGIFAPCIVTTKMVINAIEI